MLIEYSFCQYKLYNSVSLCNNIVNIKVGDILSIQSPTDPGYGGYHFQYLYSDIWDKPPFRRTNMGGQGNFRAVIQKIYNHNNSREVLAIASNERTGSQFYISLQGAIMTNEVVPEGKNYFTRFKAFLCYLETINNISDTIGSSYLNNFREIVNNQNEFEIKRRIESGMDNCKYWKSIPLPKKNYLAFSSATFEDYDFQKKGFILKNMYSEDDYDVETGYKMRKAILNFENIQSEYFLEMDETTAEIMLTFLKSHNLPRKIYYQYEFDLKGNRIKPLDLQRSLMDEHYTQNGFIEDAIVKKITFYQDMYMTQQLISKDLTKGGNDKSAINNSTSTQIDDSDYNYLATDTAFFFETAKKETRKNNYLLKDQFVHGHKELDGFVFLKTINAQSVEEKGWVEKNKLSLISTSKILNPSSVIKSSGFKEKILTIINNNDTNYNIFKDYNYSGEFKLKSKCQNEEIRFNSSLQNIEMYSYIVSNNNLKVKSELELLGAKFSDDKSGDWNKIDCCRIYLEHINDSQTKVTYFIACGD